MDRQQLLCILLQNWLTAEEVIDGEKITGDEPPSDIWYLYSECFKNKIGPYSTHTVAR